MIARAVLRHELVFFFAPRRYKLAGEHGADGSYYHSFLHVRPDPDGATHIPLLLAQQRSASLFAENDDASPTGEAEQVDEDAQRAFFADEQGVATAHTEPFDLSATVSSGPLLHNERPGDAPRRPKLGHSSTTNLLRGLTSRPDFQEAEEKGEDDEPRVQSAQESAATSQGRALAASPPPRSPRGTLPPLAATGTMMPVAEDEQQRSPLPEGVAPAPM